MRPRSMAAFDFPAFNRGVDANTRLTYLNNGIHTLSLWMPCDYIYYCLYFLSTFCHLIFSCFIIAPLALSLFSPLPPFAEVAVPAMTLTK